MNIFNQFYSEVSNKDNVQNKNNIKYNLYLKLKVTFLIVINQETLLTFFVAVTYLFKHVYFDL